MLAQRIGTAIVMLGVLTIAARQPSPVALLILLSLLATCALWEWLRLLVPEGKANLALYRAIGYFILMCFLMLLWFVPDTQLVDMLALWAQHIDLDITPWASLLAAVGQSLARRAHNIHIGITQWLMPLAAVLWLTGATWAVVHAHTQPDAHTKSRTRAVIVAHGAILLAWAASVLLYQVHGVWLLVSLMALVWSADIAAYFVGRAWGRHKLAPQVSPGKTWEGAVGGVLAAVAWTLASVQWEGSFGALLAARYGLVVAALLAALLAALSIVGDLYESLLKRRAGVKDSSGLLPGHGGVLDRIDALLPVAPAAYCLLHAWS